MVPASLFGRDCMDDENSVELARNSHNIHWWQINQPVKLSQQVGLGTLKDYKAKIYVVPRQGHAKFCKARPVPYSVKTKN